MFKIRNIFLAVLWIYYLLPFQLKAVGINLPLGLPDLSLERFSILYMVMVLIMWRRKNSSRATSSNFNIFLKLFIIYVIFAVFLSDNPSYYLLKFLNNLLIPLIIFYAFNTIHYSQLHTNRLIQSLSSITLILGAYSLFEYITHINPFYNIPNFTNIEMYTVYHGADTAQAGFINRGIQIFRSTGPYYDWAPFGTIMAMIAPIFTTKYYLSHKKIFLFYAIVTSIAVIFTFTRSVILVIVLGFAISALNIPNKGKFFFPVIIGAIGIVFMLIYADQLMGSQIVRERFLKYETIESRYQKWRVVNEMTKDEKLLFFGMHYSGVKNYLDPASNRYRGDKSVYSGSHQLYINYLFEYGLIGLLLYLLAILSYFLRIKDSYNKAKTNKDRWPIAVYLFSLSIIFLYHIATIFFYNTLLNPLLWLGIGLGLKQRQIDLQKYQI